MTFIGRISALITSIGLDIKSLYGRVLPSGGTSGQVLAKTSTTDYAVRWINPASNEASIKALEDSIEQSKINEATRLIQTQDIIAKTLL